MLSAKLKTCYTCSQTAASTIKQLIGCLLTPRLSPATSILPSVTLCSLFFISLKSTLSHPLQPFLPVLGTYTSLYLGFALSYCSPSLLLHSTILPPSREDSLSIVTPLSKMCIFLFFCLSCIEFWLEEVKPDYRKPMSVTLVVDWFLGNFQTPGAAAPPSVTDLA